VTRAQPLSLEDDLPLDLAIRWDDGPATLGAVAALRDAFGTGRVLNWRVEAMPRTVVPLLWHLPPPGNAAPDFAEWRSVFRPGLCYYRRGPGFVQVKDVRDPEEAGSFTIDEPHVLRAFLRCLRPTALTDLDALERDAAEALLDERLLLRAADQVVVLPYRMRRWPVPAMGL
jgi:hypothetical protein